MKQNKKGFRISTDTIIITIVMLILLIIIIVKAGDYTAGINDCNEHWLKQLTPEEQNNPFINNFTIKNNETINFDKEAIK